MIIIKIIGGLGNQMFQYALGRALSIKNNVEFKMDLSGFESYKLHDYSLKHFNITENIATFKEIKSIKNKKLLQLFYRHSSQIIEKYFYYDSAILKVIDKVYLDGYWQSEKYFNDISEVIRKDFTVKHQQAGRNKEIAELIEDSNSVSLHIRRGDYVSNKITNTVHGLCNLDYYNRAIIYIAEKFSNLHFFVFSDDPIWTKKYISVKENITYVDHNKADKNYEDLRLMSQCKHHIIANSSFSWWGAWLNQNPDKIVIAPRKWFNEDSIDTKDLIPESWIRL